MCYRYVRFKVSISKTNSICSALMTLHESRPDTAKNELDGPESFESSLSRITEISKRFNKKIDQVDVDAISPFPPDGVFKAASI